MHRVFFHPSGRSTLAADGETILAAANRAGEKVPAECGGRGACGRCLVRVIDGHVPEYRILHREAGAPEVLACLAPVHGPLTVHALVEADLPRLVSRARNVGLAPLDAWAPWALPLRPPLSLAGRDLGVAVDVGTTTLRLAVIRLTDGVIVGEASAYNPQIPRGADVISRIVAAEKGLLGDLASSVRGAVRDMLREAARPSGLALDRIAGYSVAGNVTMTHLLLGEDPSGIRAVPSVPRSLAFEPVDAARLGWPGRADARVDTMPAAGGWVGGDIVAGMVRTGMSRETEGLVLYIDLGTNGEIALGGRDFALTCACSAGPAFEGGGIRCGMRADEGAIDGARIDPETGALDVSVIGSGAPRGVCGSGLIALTHALFAAGWIDRGARFTAALPERHRLATASALALKLDDEGQVALWERDLASLVRAKAAIFAGIRSLLSILGNDAGEVSRIIVSGNFGRYLNLPAAIGIGLLPDAPFGRYSYIENGSLEGAALALLSADFVAATSDYLGRVTYVDLSDLPGYMDEFVAASFLPHTSPAALRLK